MRLLIVGTLKGQLTTATKIAMDNGASVTHAEDHEQAMRVLRGGKGADLLLVDVALDIRDLVMRLPAAQVDSPPAPPDLGMRPGPDPIPRPDRRLRHPQRCPRRGRRYPRRRQGIHPAA